MSVVDEAKPPTAELLGDCYRAGDGNRTRVLSLGSRGVRYVRVQESSFWYLEALGTATNVAESKRSRDHRGMKLFS